MKKPGPILSCTLIALLILLAGLYGLADHYLNSEGFQKQLLAEISRRLHCEIHLEKMKIHILRGADLTNIHVASDDFRPREFMNAERLRLRYDLPEVFFHQKRLWKELKLNTPQIHIDLSKPALPKDIETPDSLSNPPFSSNRETSSPPLPSQQNSRTDSHWPAPPPINLRRFIVENGSLAIIMPDRDRLILHGTQIQAAFSLDPVPSSSGNISCEKIDLPKNIKLTDAKATFLWRKDSLSIPKITSNLLGGSVEGNFKANHNKTKTPFELQISVDHLGVNDLFRLMGSQNASFSHNEIRGELKAQAKFEGSLSEPEMIQGQGQVRILEARLVNISGLTLLGGFLNHPEFQDLPLEKCEIDFVLRAGRLQIAHFETHTAEIQLAGDGWINLMDRSQEFQMKLVLSDNLAAKIPVEILNGLNRRTDGYVEVPFRIWGNLSHPKNDLANRFESLAVRAISGTLFDKIFQAIPTQ